MPRLTLVLAVSVAAVLAGCGEQATLPASAGFGPDPTLPAPHATLLPTMHIAPARGWPLGATPAAAPGLKVAAFAAGLAHPRWLYVLPNGDVLVAETNGPARSDDDKGLAGMVGKVIMGRAGARAPSANRITLLRDTRGTGVADVRTVFLTGLNSPFGMALIGGDLYVADTDAILKFPYTPGATAITAPGVKVVDLPAGPRNHHWTKNIIAGPGGALFASVGSNSNVGENGLAAEAGRAAIWRVDPATGARRIFASGLRNPNGMAFEPSGGALWTAVNERDEIGSDLVPDYMTSVRDGGFYGWPFSYYGQHVDTRISPQRPDLVARAIKPDYALGSHTASLGLAFSDRAAALPPAFAHGAFVGQHGSWNRKPFAGYKVIFVPFAGAKPAGPPVDVLTGFITASGDAQGRPVGVTIDRRGALLVADDVGNIVWRVTAASPTR